MAPRRLRPVTREEIERIGGVPLPEEHAERIVAHVNRLKSSNEDSYAEMCRQAETSPHDSIAQSLKRSFAPRRVRRIAIALAMDDSMNNFHNRTPYEDPERRHVNRLTPLIDAALVRHGIDGAAWHRSEYKRYWRIYGQAYAKHRLRLWPVYLEMLAHVHDQQEVHDLLTG